MKWLIGIVAVMLIAHYFWRRAERQSRAIERQSGAVERQSEAVERQSGAPERQSRCDDPPGGD